MKAAIILSLLTLASAIYSHKLYDKKLAKKYQKGQKGGGIVVDKVVEVVPEQPCHTVIDEVWEEQCFTKYDNVCEVKPLNKCHTVQARECGPQTEEKCSIVFTEKCKKIPVPFCNINWEKSCTTSPYCNTVQENVCETINKDVCVTHIDKSCTMTTEKVCIKRAVPTSEIPVTGHVAAGPVLGPVVSPNPILGPAPVVQTTSGGLPIISHVAPVQTVQSGPQIVIPRIHVQRSTPDEASEPDYDFGPGSFPQDVTDGDALEVDQKEAEEEFDASDIGPFGEPILSEEEIDEEISTLKAKGELEEIERVERDLSAIKSKIEEKLAIKKAYKNAKAQLKAQKKGQIDALVSGYVGTKGYKGKGYKGKGKGGVLIKEVPVPAPIQVVYQEECHDEPRQKCVDVPREACHKEPVQNCRVVPKEVCVDQEKCTNWPKKDCGIQHKETCVPVPTKQCSPVVHNVCRTLPREECRQVNHEVCSAVPIKDCQKNLVQKPRQVCPQTTTRMLEDW